MNARIFISYRSADGIDKATALGRDLGAVFGAEQVFLDKDDLAGGSVWRNEIDRTLARDSVLLLLITPQLLTAREAQGRLRIDDPDDPVRRELERALQVGAAIVPVLCDAEAAPPNAATLPAPFDRIGERTWRRLRAHDWNVDLQRLIDDIETLGVARRLQSGGGRPGTRRRGLASAAVAVAIAAAGAAGLAAWLANDASSDPEEGLSGEWLATLDGDPPFTLVLRQRGASLTLTSTPIAIAGRADWADYRRFWREQGGTDLDHVVYRGEGMLRSDPGVAPLIDVALQIVSQPGDVPVDSGNLQASLAPDGSRMDGRLWLNSAQADRPIRLQRRPG